VLGLRQKISLGFAGLSIIILIIGAQSLHHLSSLGESIDVILRENYRSVIACQQMKDALERIDSGLLFVLLGESEQGNDLVLGSADAFERALRIELDTITLPGEGEKASHLRDLFARYKSLFPEIRDESLPASTRHSAYFGTLLPLFDEIKRTADDILQMNQENMSDANDRARRTAASARQSMYVLLAAGTVVAIVFIIFMGRWVLRPIQHFIRSADEIRRGNLDLVVSVKSHDEIGHLSEAFNAMAASLRNFRRTDQARLLRIQWATQQAFDRLADSVAVVDLEGTVEVASASAAEVFGLRPSARVFGLPFGLGELFNDALREGRPVPQKGGQQVIQKFPGGEERFFSPEAVPILDPDRRPTGVIIVLKDVTQVRQQDEIKRGVIQTVSHQLKTPLTSMRMAIHLLLEEKVGSLTEKQADLLMTAREDSNRLNGILNSLLDMSRMEAGKSPFEFSAVPLQTLLIQAVEPFRRAAQDQGVVLAVEKTGDNPEVRIDSTRIIHVFGNLIANALKYTAPGGNITLSGRSEDGLVRCLVSDTGSGIPEQYLRKVFEPFFRVPDPGNTKGAGLGLAIAREIVEAHGGTMDVESREGVGTTFSFTLRKAGPADGERQIS
jgi:two-component system, NtrC family, sensor histidine kinase KinB